MSGTTAHRPGGAVVFRQLPAGGELRDEPWVVGAPGLHRRIVLWLHGYNVTHDAAVGSYGEMHDGLHNRGIRDPGATFWVFWPGDATGFLRSKLSYSAKVKNTPDYAERLANWLSAVRRQSPRSYPEEVVIVAHSLGCRVTLETLHRLAPPAAGGTAPNPPRVAGLVLMAAAVPSDVCAGTGRFGPSLSSGLAVRPPARETVLWSGRDTVLRFAFPPGQKLAGESASHAVGRKGGPAGRWRRPVDAGYGHGDYWKGRLSHEEVQLTLTGAVAEHALPANLLPPNPGGETFDPVAENALPSNQIGDIRSASRGAYLTR